MLILAFIVAFIWAALLTGAVLRLQQQGERIMATQEQFRAKIAEIDAETTRIGIRMEELIAQQQAGGLTGQQEEEILVELGTLAERLKVVGADPENPVPPIE